MNPEPPAFAQSTDDRGRPIVALGATRVSTPAELVAADPALKTPGRLGDYCRAVNHLKYGYEFRVIHDPDAYREKYERRLSSEDPNSPFRENVPRLRHFGVCRTGEIRAPRLEGDSIVFYVEDVYLGIPYHVTAPPPDRPDGETSYEPVPMAPFPGDRAPGPARP